MSTQKTKILTRIPLTPNLTPAIKNWTTDKSTWVRSANDWPTTEDPVTKQQVTIIPDNQGILTGFPSGNICVIDVDNKNNTPFKEVTDWLSSTFNINPDTTLTATTKSAGLHYYIQCDHRALTNRANIPIPGIKGKTGLDFRGTGGYVVAPPTPQYAWLDEDQPIMEAPETFYDWYFSSQNNSNSPQGPSGDDILYQALSQKGIDSGERNDLLFKLACSMAKRFSHEPEAVSFIYNILLTAADHCNPPYRGQVEDQELQSMAERSIKFVQTNTQVPVPNKANHITPALENYTARLTWPTDAAGLVDRLMTTTAAVSWLYDPATGWWKKDIVWKHIPDDLHLREFIPLFEQIRLTELEAGAEVKHINALRRAYGGSTDAINKHLRIALTVPQFNPTSRTSLDWIGFTNGVLNIKTGEFLAELPQDIHSTTAFDYPYEPGNTSSPMWDKFITRLMNNDNDLINAVHHILGYSLIGNNPDSKFFLFIGAAQAGKSLFMNAVRQVFSGTASTSIDSSVFTTRASFASDNATKGAAYMRALSARVVVASEVGHSQLLDTDGIKLITGGDEVTARLAYAKKALVFTPTFTPFMVGNDDPPFYASASQALKRRLVKVPIIASVPDSEVIPAQVMLQHFRDEAPAIFNKIFTAAQEYLTSEQKIDALIFKSQTLKSTSQQFMADADFFLPFFEAETITETGASTPAANFLSAYKAYYSQLEALSTKDIPSTRALTKRLLEAGYRKQRTSSGYIWHGIRLKEPQESPNQMVLYPGIGPDPIDVTFGTKPVSAPGNNRRIQSGASQTSLKAVK